MHQFTKVEMFGVTEGNLEASQKLQQEFADIEKSLFKELGLHCKVLDMPPIDLGKPAFRKIDIEAWMGGHGFYGKLHFPRELIYEFPSLIFERNIIEFNSLQRSIDTLDSFDRGNIFDFRLH